VRRRILRGLGLQQLVGILVKRINYIARWYCGLVDGWKLGQVDRVPLGLWLDQLLHL